LCEAGYMHISGLGSDKLKELKTCARQGIMTDNERKKRSDAGSGIREVFTKAFSSLVAEFGESMPHITTNKPGTVTIQCLCMCISMIER
jgi:hypothetical protein